ncbi:MAG: aspartate kinase, partial [Anaerolineae bacterium]
MSLLTMKFGGTSVGSADAIERAADIVRSQARAWDRVVVVVSAMSGVTDALIRGARSAASGDDGTYRAIVSDLRARHYGVVDALFRPGPAGGPDLNGERAALLAMVDQYLDEFAVFCHSVRILGEVTPRAMDAISSLGEPLSARLLAVRLSRLGIESEAVDATELIVTDDTF